ncbi:nickel-dependent lactate racemase [Paenibacillus sp. WQ 127069]|uniref:Nickel-dependent lactate racemase n=1 Tax=Paenibacillus baimaensis TaxID=2982185 RepID=A0ABT2U8K3_9BACL|nr:nickel-dependent lactate racemase [Paenibacillus sp. WQ 127069]MCU6790915.1 nickel-dependent lactate racemase [Paenibacillus sp. WQ 127069]
MLLPKFVKVKQHFNGPKIDDIEAEISKQMEAIRLSDKVKPGMKVAITAGSRGIANIALIIKNVVNELKKLGVEPRIIPTMGSHGGATAEGQIEVLEGLGVTEDYCGAPILSSMEVTQIGETPAGLAVYADNNILASDAVIVIARIKVHTDFKSSQWIESGIVKMAAIGIGKHKQALLLHSYGIHGIRDLMPAVGQVTLDKLNVLFGLGIVENAFDQTAIIEAIEAKQIVEREQALLKISKSMMPKLPVDDIDVLFVDEIGKNYSGTGMDTNIIGRMRILGEEELDSPRIKYIVASDLSEPSHGNALGMGLADLTTKRFFDKIDMKITNENVITSSFIMRGMIPMVIDNDREALHVALRCNWGIESSQARIVRVPNTLHLKYVYVSEALVPEIQKLSHIEILGQPKPLQFDENGYLPKMAEHD